MKNSAIYEKTKAINDLNRRLSCKNKKIFSIKSKTKIFKLKKNTPIKVKEASEIPNRLYKKSLCHIIIRAVNI